METYYQKNRDHILEKRREFHKNHPDYQREYLKKRIALNPNYLKEIREKRKEKQKEYYKNWYKNNGRNRTDRQYEAVYEWAAEHPDRKNIMYRVNYAISKGKIIRPEICSRCGNKGKIHAHHYNYDNYMNFIWLCASCHKLEHLSQKKG